MLLSCFFLVFVALTQATLYPPDVEDFLDENLTYSQDDGGKLWVLIVAGSNGYYNYRHQADAYHAYHIMRRHGIPDSQIIMMHYDDIAHDTENPTPGIVINHPDGSDVYKGVPKDYTGNDVNSENFLKILTGDADAMKGISSGKVIASGPNDHVFVNFIDHGAEGIVAFPNDELSALDLNKAIKSMYQNNQYAKMVMYFEACESGSMFDGLLPNNINVFVTTASNPTESSYACYYDDFRGTYLGDVYSVNWMEDADAENIQKETLQSQYLLVKKETNTSHVMEYGNITMGKLFISEFMGDDNPARIRLPKASKADAVPQDQVYMSILKKKIKNAQSAEERKYWIAHVDLANKKRSFVLSTLRKIADAVSRGHSHTESLLQTRRPVESDAHECLDAANKYFSQRCFSLAKNDFAMFNAPRLLSNACMDGISWELLIQVMDDICVHQKVTGIH